MYPQDGEVRHGGVVDGDARVRGVPNWRENLGSGRARAVVEHLAKRVDVDVFWGQAGSYRVVGARHALDTI